ncbi:hypothetical protein [Terracoccus sp. 273MFTsu3.1]|uniref:hypothetical protein n=1 Tax=Terracoccus sp. 273MFTsu3.1 TaxID=1172188 RepID=UPI0003697CC8|nr:hypothetical protein [Terracoccus sp. 273MFTsu3.1]
MPRTVRRTTRSRDEIDEQDEDRPTRRGSHREERPARRGRSRDEDTDNGFDDDDDDEPEEKPRARRASRVKDEPKRKSGRAAASGWGAAEEVREAIPSTGNFAEDLKLPEKGKIIIKFVEDEPFDSYAEHWVPQKGKQSFTCAGEDCPLCEVGNRPNAKICFNVISLADPAKPELKRWRTGVQIAETIKEFTVKGEKTAPLSREDYYYEVKRAKTANDKTVTTVTPIKARDLDSDYDIEPLTDDDIDEAIEKAGGLYDWESTEDTPMSVLEQQADKAAA